MNWPPKRRPFTSELGLKEKSDDGLLLLCWFGCWCFCFLLCFFFSFSSMRFVNFLVEAVLLSFLLLSVMAAHSIAFQDM
jgi:hypothetical protein